MVAHGVGKNKKGSISLVTSHLITSNLSCRYGRVELWEDLKKLYQMCGVEEREVAFLLTDSQITNEIFLEDISNILISGEVPGTLSLLPQGLCSCISWQRCCPSISCDTSCRNCLMS